MKQTEKKIMSIKCDGVREFVDVMNNTGDKRIWISANDPISKTLATVDEKLEYALEISVENYRESEHLLTEAEQESFRAGKYWELTGVELTGQQKFLLSYEYMQGMALYLQNKFRKDLEGSLLRVNGKIEVLKEGVLPVYDVDPEKGAYYLDEDQEIKKVENKTRLNIPFLELSSWSSKVVESIWDVKVDDHSSEVLNLENELYEKIVKELGEDLELIIVPVRTPLTVLPTVSWAEGEMGFTSFEQVGIGVYLK